MTTPTQDSAIPPKKLFFKELVTSLRHIAAHNPTNIPPKSNTTKAFPINIVPIPNVNAEEKGKKAQKIETNRPITRARIVEIEPMERGGEVKAAEVRLSPKEVRGMIKENCGLIKTVEDPKQVAGIERRLKRIYEARKCGASTPDTLARYLERECDLEPWQAERIVRDQMNKFDRGTELEKMRKSGVKLVRWCHGDCKDPRPYHIKHWDGHSGLRNGRPNGLSGFVFDIDKPPVIDLATGERGYPGDLVMCSCHLEAVE